MAERLGISSRALIGILFSELEKAMSLGVELLAMENPDSDQETETYRWLNATPALREWIGGRQAKGLTANGFTIQNKKWEGTLEFQIDDLRRNKIGQVQIRIGELADRAAQHPLGLIASLINNGGSTACYDGQNFFSATHSEGNSGTLSNLLTVSDYSELNIATPANPTPVEFAQGLLKVIQHFYTLKDDQGQPINEGAREFAVLVPINQWAAAHQAITSQNLSTGTGAIDNPVLKGEFKVRLFPNARLTGTTDFHVFRTDGRAKPFIKQTEKKFMARVLGEDSEYAIMNDKVLFMLDGIYNCGYGRWQHAMKATWS